MLSHVFLGTNHFDRALAFYRPLMGVLRLHERFCDPQRPWAAWEVAPGVRPLLLLGRPFDGGPAAPGNGQMVALQAPNREVVDQAHALALQHGGTDEGAPGLRPHYHANYYGAYFRDPDGNKLCVVCHTPPAD
jgi:lactoylglutathione lyase